MKILKEVRVAISGKSGCGNTTVSTLLSEKLGVKLINFTFRQLAAEKGMTLAQVIENAKTDDSYDIAVDTRQVEMARAEPCVLGSRLAVWMLKEADLKVYLKLDDDIRAKRIFNREGGDIEEIKTYIGEQLEEMSAYMSVGTGKITIGETAAAIKNSMTSTTMNIPLLTL